MGHEWLQTTELAQSETPLDSFRQVIRLLIASTVARSPHVQKPRALFQLLDLATHFGVLFVKRIGKQETRQSSGCFLGVEVFFFISRTDGWVISLFIFY